MFIAFPLSSQCYSAHAAYCRSKLAQLLFSSHLHQELQRGGFPLSSCAVDPGMVDTALYRHLWTPLCLAQSAIARLLFKVKHCPDFHLSFTHLIYVTLQGSKADMTNIKAHVIINCGKIKLWFKHSSTVFDQKPDSIIY